MVSISICIPNFSPVLQIAHICLQAISTLIFHKVLKLQCQKWIQLLFFSYKPAPNPTCLTSGSDMPIDFVAQPRNLGFSYEVFALGMPNFLPASNSPSPLQKWSFKTANTIISRYSILIPVFLPLHPPPSSNDPPNTSGWIQSSYHALNFLSF